MNEVITIAFFYKIYYKKSGSEEGMTQWLMAASKGGTPCITNTSETLKNRQPRQSNYNKQKVTKPRWL